MSENMSEKIIVEAIHKLELNPYPSTYPSIDDTTNDGSSMLHICTPIGECNHVYIGAPVPTERNIFIGEKSAYNVREGHDCVVIGNGAIPYVKKAVLSVVLTDNEEPIQGTVDNVDTVQELDRDFITTKQWWDETQEKLNTYTQDPTFLRFMCKDIIRPLILKATSPLREYIRNVDNHINDDEYDNSDYDRVMDAYSRDYS